MARMGGACFNGMEEMEAPLARCRGKCRLGIWGLQVCYGNWDFFGLRHGWKPCRSGFTYYC